MSPPESSSSPGPPNVFRQAFVFYVVVLVALLFSFALASIVAGVLEVGSPILFMLLIAPLLIAVVLFIQVDTLVERRLEAILAESTTQHSGGRNTTTAED